MKFLYCDETNMHVREDDFLIYGGVTIQADKFLEFSEAIDSLRQEFGVPTDFQLKFNPGPDGMSHSDFISLKSKIVETSIAFGCEFLVYNILHQVSSSPDVARRNGINELCLNFSYILRSDESTGMILIDRFNDEGNVIDSHLRDKFSVGLRGLPITDPFSLTRVVGLHYSAIGQSHMPSVVDIVLGSYRFATNCFARGESRFEATSRTIMRSLHPMFRKGSDAISIPRISISFSPKEVRSAMYRERYANLISGIESCEYSLDQRY